LLTNQLIQKYSHEREAPGTSQQSLEGVSLDAARMLFDYTWPGNVRELENLIERAVILSSGKLITPADLPPQICKGTGSRLNLEGITENIGSQLNLEGIPENAGLNETLTAVEKRMIQRAMALAGNIQTKAADILGIGKSGLNQKLKKYGL
ncbi:MAG: hypothetical protein HQK61_12735, partial [Desulfamplus sp.]|nr:hypothetical protein [Desulfamplus sp.]